MTTQSTTWKLTLTYDGGPFSGWQVQPGLPTVQGTLAAVIERISGEPVLPQGSGRTDAGVHALGQVASFTLAAPIPAPNLLRALNRALPPSIRILTAESVPASFHARHSALRKTYEYHIFERQPQIRVPHVPLPGHGLPQLSDPVCSPFLAPYAWDCRWPLALAPMQQAAALFLGTHDFTSFAAADPDLTTRNERTALKGTGFSVLKETNLSVLKGTGFSPSVEADSDSGALAPEGTTPNTRTLFHSAVTREDGLLRYRVTGSGFLHHMVRNILGTLVEVGRGALAAEEIPRILAARDRSAAGPTAPARGLYLVSVEYPAELTSQTSELTPLQDQPSPTPEGPRA